MMTTDVEIRPAQQAQPPQDRPEEGPLAVALRQQILDAMDPVMDDLLQDIQEAVHQQIAYVLRMSEQEVHQQVDQAVEPMRQEVQQHGDQVLHEAKLDQQRPPQTQLQQAIDRTVKALKKTLQWLTRALRALIRAAVELLKAVLSLVQAVLLALFEGLKSLGQATGQGAAFVARGVTEGTKSLLLKMAQGVVNTLDDKPDGHQRRCQPARR
jgi:DNA-directed RNA polymerase specialized sigma24 family protein